MKKIVSLLLVCALVVALFPAVFSVTAAAEEEPATSSSGLELSKTAEYDEDGQLWVTLEAYATGSSTESDDSLVPVDFVLVLDQSGSMAEAMTKEGYGAYTGDQTRNSSLYSKRHNNNGSNGNLYYKDGNTYYPVSVTRQQVVTYTALPETTTNTEYNSKRNNLYADANGSTKVDVDWDFGYPIRYTYTIGSSTYTSSGMNEVPSFIETHGPLYEKSTTNSYIYTYTKGSSTIILNSGEKASVGDNTLFSDVTLYSKSSNTSQTRLDALISAADLFVDAVHKKAVDNNVNHRVAVVGFSSNTSSYENTEVLTGVTITQGTSNYGNSPVANSSYHYYYPRSYRYNGVQYGSSNINTAYKSALQSMDTGAGYNNVAAAIDALTAHGGTQTDHGLAMAQGIFDQNPISAGTERKRVVVLLTDGIPTGNGSNYDQSTFNAAKKIADSLKGTSYGATIYTIGIFDGANATLAGSTGNGSSDADKGNYVCQQLSSNKDGKPQTPSYYLSAGTSEALNQIFTNIAGEADVTATSSTTLGASAVIQDIIAPQFELPNNAAITLQTYACSGVANGVPTFSTTPNKKDGTTTDDTMGAAVIKSDDQINVSGFDFAENWCGQATDIDGNTTYRGNKLVIKFPVQTKSGFLGGNDVYTNAEAKVYKNPEDAYKGENSVDTFPKPTVNVPIENVTVTAADKNVYLLGSLTAEQIKSGATVKCGDVSLNLAADNYGLETWQTDYVNISVTYTDASGNTITNLSDLKDDTTYTVTATITPKTDGSTTTQGTVAIKKSGNATGNINVFKPELTFKDSEAYYGDTAPANYSGNNTGEAWKHGTTLSTAVTMIGTAPTLSLSYTPEADKISTEKINTKSDFAVDVTVKIGTTDVTDKTTFVHTKCNTNEDDPTNGKFWIHVKTCTLTISKAAQTGTTIGNDEYFIFNVKKDGEAYTQVTIKGTGSITISELPVGTYTVEEDGATAWRYTVAYTDNATAALSSTKPTGGITATNTKEKDKWLNYFTRVINTYGSATGVAD